MEKSESIKELATALAIAQGEMPAVKFNATNPFLRNRYADLGAIIETSKPILAKHGLSVTQLTETVDDNVCVTTVLMHKSGEWMQATASLRLSEEKGKSLAQVAGSIITYLRRYSLASVIGLYADEDTDGEPKPEQPKKQSAPKLTTTDKPEMSMSIETAKALTNSDGVLYGEIETAKLANMANAIRKALSKPGQPQEVIDERQMKLDAIGIILKSRSQKE